MDALKEDYESRDYYDHFVSSQKLVTQLQADLQSYTQLLQDMELSCSLQVSIFLQIKGINMSIYEPPRGHVILCHM